MLKNLNDTDGLGLLEPDTASRASAMAVRIGDRLLDRFRDLPTGRGLVGSSGFALVFSALAQLTDDPKYWEAMHVCLRQAALADDRPSIGLFTGISGLRAAAAILAAEHPQYRRIIAQCDAYVDGLLTKAPSNSAASFSDFDVIAGWSGARLARCVSSRQKQDKLVELLGWLLEDDARWCCVHPIRSGEPPENDLGVAHGIAGVLATLALTTEPIDDGLQRLVSRHAQRLMSNAVREDGRILWPPVLQHKRLVTQRAWCYGTPGTAASLYLVGARLANSAVTDFALEALAAEATTNLESPPFWDHALCHGSLGVAMIFASVGLESRHDGLLSGVERLVRLALDQLETEERTWWGAVPGSDDRNLAGHLDGAGGTALALVTLSGGSTPAWIRLHALSPWKVGANAGIHDGEARSII